MTVISMKRAVCKGSVAALALGVAGLAQAEDGEQRLDVVTVTSDRLAEDPGAFYSVTPEVIAATGADHPAQVLNAAPGVNIQMNSGQEHLVSLRSPVLTGGAGQGSFLILVDGAPTRAPAFGNVNSLFELPYETAAGIEIIRGPASAQYGSNAVHGVINVIQAAPGEDAGYSARATASTLDRYRFDALASGQNKDLSWRLGGSLQHDNGWREESGLQQQKLSAALSGEAGAWRLTGDVFGVNLTQETAGFLQGEDAYKDEDLIETNANPEAFRNASYARARLQAQRDLGAGEITLTPFALTQRMDFRQHFLPYKGLEENGQDSVGLLSRYTRPIGDHELRLGVDVQWADGFIKETQDQPHPAPVFPVGVHYDFDVQTISYAGFGEMRWRPGDDWLIRAGLRIEHHDYDYTTNTSAGTFGRFKVAEDRTDSFDLATPKLGVVWSGLENAAIYANYARGERAPQASDLYRLQDQQGVGEAEVETLDSFEVGVRGELAPFGIRYDIAAYTAQKENFFFRDADGLNVTDGATDHKGIELDLSRAATSGFDWRLGLSYADHTYAFGRDVGNASEVITDGDKVDTAPEWLADARIGYVFDRAALHVEIEHIGEYFTNAANTQDYPGHTIAHLRGRWDLSDRISLDAAVHNLFDARYADRADFAFGNERYFPGEPLSVIIGVKVTG